MQSLRDRLNQLPKDRQAGQGQDQAFGLTDETAEEVKAKE